MNEREKQMTEAAYDRYAMGGVGTAVATKTTPHRSKPRPRWPMFLCQECGKKFYTTAAAERATNNGCPGCGGVDIDLG